MPGIVLEEKMSLSLRHSRHPVDVVDVLHRVVVLHTLGHATWAEWYICRYAPEGALDMCASGGSEPGDTYTQAMAGIRAIRLSARRRWQRAQQHSRPSGNAAVAASRASDTCARTQAVA